MLSDILNDFEFLWSNTGAMLEFSSGVQVRMVPARLRAEDVVFVGGVVGKKNYSAVVLENELADAGEFAKAGRYAIWNGTRFKISAIEFSPASPLVHITLTEV